MYNYNYSMQMTQGAVINHLLKRHSLICLDSIKHIIKTHSAIQKIERQVIKDKHSTASHFSWRCHCSIWLYQDLNEHNSLCTRSRRAALIEWVMLKDPFNVNHILAFDTGLESRSTLVFGIIWWEFRAINNGTKCTQHTFKETLF